jgi:hypothetical protein
MVGAGKVCAGAWPVLAEVVPTLIREPATIALPGLGGLAILRKRR